MLRIVFYRKALNPTLLMFNMKWFFGLNPGDKVKIKDNYYYISDFFPSINILFNILYIIKENKLYNKIKSKGFKREFSIKENLVMADSGPTIWQY